MHRPASTGQPGVVTEAGLGTYADRRLDGAKMNTVTEDFVQLMHVGGTDYLFHPAIEVDVAIIRATTADPCGNLSYEQECGSLGGLDQAYAAHNTGGIVIARGRAGLSYDERSIEIGALPSIGTVGDSFEGPGRAGAADRRGLCSSR